MWFTEARSASIGRIDQSGQLTEYPIPGSFRANDLTIGPGATIWFTAGSGRPGEKPQIGEVTREGAVRMFDTPLPVDAVPFGLTFRGSNTGYDDGHLYFVAGDQVWRMTLPA